ncbi:DUF1499 domain-containing protein [Parahaliea sp. F7430]|uniref:DUF1499 domain-containing protein n=1 Tax=Sediminihaliea albiluteola TaxID=2758564 RepID=A0A7W2YJ89_9GAMM|nr:DUF1499 domain-containing protein [Sediminihaliea albiluteola]MBA6412895.1 DUF1499 domain-containing protein [Sediminihaliea albiluteola]
MLSSTQAIAPGFIILRKLCFAAALALPVAVVIVRLGWWQSGLLLYAIACLLAAVLLALSIALSLVPRLRPLRKHLAITALCALPGSLLLAITLAGQGDRPAIHDISTDLVQPPVFTNAPLLRGSDSNPLTIDPANHQQQRRAYPDIGTVHSQLAVEAAYQRAGQTAETLGWEVVYMDAEQGQLEAVASTPIMGFKDDIVIRLQAAAGGGSDIDLRSVSRVGVGDMGANAKRIRAFIEQFSQQE